MGVGREFMRSRIAGLTVACISVAFTSSAQEVDALATVTSRLAEKGDFLISESCRNVCTATRLGRCISWSSVPLVQDDSATPNPPETANLDSREREPPIRNRRCLERENICTSTRRDCNRVNGKLTPQELDAFITDQRYGESERLGGVDKWYRTGTTIVNCTSERQSSTTSLSLNVANSNTIVISNRISRTRAFSLGIKAGFTFIYQGGVTARYNVSRTVSASHSNSTTESASLNFSQSVPVQAAPKTQITAVMSAFTRSYRMPFTATVVVDGALIPNKSANTKVSDLLPESERTFSVRGHIDSTFGTDANISFEEAPANCAGHEGSIRVIELAPREYLVDQDIQAEDISSVLFHYDQTPDLNLNGLSLEDAISLGQVADRRLSEVRESFPGVIAEGFHQCQSGTSLGHSCNVFGYFEDCLAADLALSSEDCCFGTPDGGVSIGYSTSYCAPF